MLPSHERWPVRQRCWRGIALQTRTLLLRGDETTPTITIDATDAPGPEQEQQPGRPRSCCWFGLIPEVRSSGWDDEFPALSVAVPVRPVCRHLAPARRHGLRSGAGRQPVALGCRRVVPPFAASTSSRKARSMRERSGLCRAHQCSAPIPPSLHRRRRRVMWQQRPCPELGDYDPPKPLVTALSRPELRDMPCKWGI
jgi:hypothetical protein